MVASRRLQRRSLRQLAPIPDATPGAAGRFCTLSPARPSTFSSSCRRSNLPPHTAEAGRSDPGASHVPRTTLSHVASGQPDDADPSDAATSSAFSENRRASKDPGDASPVHGGGGGRASGDGSGDGQSSDAALGPQESPEKGDADRPKSGDGLRAARWSDASETRGDDARDDCCARFMEASDSKAPPAGEGTRNMGEALRRDRSKSSYSASFWGENSGCSLISISSSSEDMACLVLWCCRRCRGDGVTASCPRRAPRARAMGGESL